MYSSKTESPINRSAKAVIQVGRYAYFVVIQVYKKVIYNIVKELRKTIKKSMATGIVQKGCTVLFPMWSLRKNDISKIKNLYVKRKHKKY